MLYISIKKLPSWNMCTKQREITLCNWKNYYHRTSKSCFPEIKLLKFRVSNWLSFLDFPLIFCVKTSAGVCVLWMLLVTFFKPQILVRHKCWDNSPHVSHFHHHPDEYVETLLSFLDYLGFSTPERAEGEREKEICQDLHEEPLRKAQKAGREWLIDWQ